ncbi:hypothetical protein OPT61_g7304 [Boeremia exigua]|uniref:Uncharacterized protein n=1 Tax=Boeremia exigua TaxID=749465 RepID=A0ACC2I3E1_9PLEO|nr:hypothetical protein OPT61_g7304 [Boeremia exigua]
MPFKEACVATGIKMGRGTGPWGRCSVAARALVTCVMLDTSLLISALPPTEHFPNSSNLSADGMGAMMYGLFERHVPQNATHQIVRVLQGSGTNFTLGRELPHSFSLAARFLSVCTVKVLRQRAPSEIQSLHRLGIHKADQRVIALLVTAVWRRDGQRTAFDDPESRGKIKSQSSRLKAQAQGLTIKRQSSKIKAQNQSLTIKSQRSRSRPNSQELRVNLKLNFKPGIKRQSSRDRAQGSKLKSQSSRSRTIKRQSSRVKARDQGLMVESHQAQDQGLTIERQSPRSRLDTQQSKLKSQKAQDQESSRSRKLKIKKAQDQGLTVKSQESRVKSQDLGWAAAAALAGQQGGQGGVVRNNGGSSGVVAVLQRKHVVDLTVVSAGGCSADSYLALLRLDCVYETKRIKPGLKSGAVENLHRRLDELERRIEQKDAESPRRTCDDADTGMSTASASSGESAAQSILALLARELPKLVNQGQSEPILAPASTRDSCKRRRQNEALDVASRTDDAPSLPTADILEPVLAAYFTQIHPWIPMIHKGRFYERLADEKQGEQLLIVLHSMVLAASKFVPGAALHVNAHTRRWIVSSAMDSLSLENLQALIILAFNDFGDGNAEKAWSIVGSMTRTVEYTQLAQEQEEGEQRPFSQPYAPLPYAVHWTEVEERRRVFWNVFLLDRLCSVTQGWNTSLTSDDVFRRLPCDGYLWRKQEPVLTPYFGIWDRSKGRIGNPIDFLSRHPSPGHGSGNVEYHKTIGDHAPSSAFTQYQHSDMSTVGAFAYNIEATESMSRVMSYFLQQKVNVRDQSDISSWLTRFKELDLRLVHWKMLLPQKWKANPNLTRQVPLMDPNLTTAHITHNASMILLHQTIAYPPLHWGFCNRLPSSCSAEACYSAGVEIATITRKYLSKSLSDSPIGSQYAFCIFIAARALLIHWRYEAEERLPAEFWSLLQSLDEMSIRWCAFAQPPPQGQNLFAKYASRLKELYERCTADPNYQIDVMNFTNDIHDRRSNVGLAYGYSPWSKSSQQASRLMPDGSAILSSNAPEPMDFASIPSLDQNFVDLDRVIAFDDGSMFTAAFEAAAAGSW